ncbi:MAG: glucose-6-phosphate dehydrogenase [Spirochaetales bacterium]|nr:glucose-6-phosphate dehydrogenase [Spirochaetales bacterium]
MKKSAVFVLFGSTGDLALKKLLPSLYSLHCQGELGDDFKIVAVGRREFDHKDFVDFIQQSVAANSRYVCDYRFISFSERISYFKMDFQLEEDYQSLSTSLLSDSLLQSGELPLIFYMATAPDFFRDITQGLAGAGFFERLKNPKRLVLEKPFGHDLASASEFNAIFSKYFTEEEIFRTDHYLGKEMVQNILSMRFANPIFEKIWNSEFIDNIQITVFETEGIGSRGGYYDSTGALRDMVQSHLLQILSLLAMERPSDLEIESLRDRKVEVIKNIKLEKVDSHQDIVFGQYVANQELGLKGYLDEEKVGAESSTETFAALKLTVDSPRWRGVPFFLRTGKRCGKRLAYVVVEFSESGSSLFPSEDLSNLLVIKIQPDEGIYLQLRAKSLGSSSQVIPVSLDYSAACSVSGRGVEAYERILSDAIDANHQLFTRWDEIESSWKFIDNVGQICGCGICLDDYQAGTPGPEAAARLIGDSNRSWREII